MTQQTVGIVLVLLGLVGLLFSLWHKPADSQVTAPKERPKLAVCRVLFVVDGDTVGCDLNGNGRYDKPIELVRFLGVDTPEMHYSKKNPTYGTEHPEDEPFAQEASKLTQSLIPKGQALVLEYDINRTDPRGRTLAYVYRSPGNSLDIKNLDVKGMVSPAEELLRCGYAEVLFFKPNIRHYQRYQALENHARAAGQGRWGRVKPR